MLAVDGLATFDRATQQRGLYMGKREPPLRRRRKHEARTNPVSWLGIIRVILAFAALLYQWWHDHN
ncbi:hypothetical protein GCM10009743_41950 [Kribbella swartbergensis]